MTAQTGAFTVEYDATPNASQHGRGRGAVGRAGLRLPDMAAVVRFNTAGLIDARNGSGYSSDATVAYAAGKAYHVRMAVSILSHAYSVYVTPAGGTEQLLAENYSFRAEQASVTSLANWAIWSGVGDPDASRSATSRSARPARPTLALSTKSLDFGLSATSMALQIWNAGGSTLSYSLSDNVNWLTVSPTSGSSAGRTGHHHRHRQPHGPRRRHVPGEHHRDAIDWAARHDRREHAVRDGAPDATQADRPLGHGALPADQRERHAQRAAWWRSRSTASPRCASRSPARATRAPRPST